MTESLHQRIEQNVVPSDSKTGSAGQEDKPPEEEETSPPAVAPMSRKALLSVIVLSIMNFMECAGYMAVMPSLIFYVRQLGGTESQYGFILAANNFSACLMMPLYGSWVDAYPNKYRTAFFVAQFLSIAGMILYSLAILFDDGDGSGATPTGIYVLFLSRILYGTGVASLSIGFTYITEVVDEEHITFCTLVLSAAQYAGLMVGPFFNTVLGWIDTDWNIFGLVTLPLNATNSVGLLLAANDFLSFVATYFFLSEPPAQRSSKGNKKDDEDTTAVGAGDQEVQRDDTQTKKAKDSWIAVFQEMSCFRLMFPVFVAAVLNANWQLVEVAFPPAAAHGLAWGPFETSVAMGLISILLMACNFGAIALTTTFEVPDAYMIFWGNVFWVVGGAQMYYYWTYPAKVWHYVLPLTLGLIGFPIIGPPVQSKFSKMTMGRPEYEPLRGRMQAIYAMMKEVANFSTPIFVGSYILRSPEEVETGEDNHELTKLAFYTPVFSFLCIAGIVYERIVYGKEDSNGDAGDERGKNMDGDRNEEDPVSESSSLLKKTVDH